MRARILLLCIIVVGMFAALGGGGSPAVSLRIFFTVVISFSIYLVPTFVADGRQHRRLLAIAVLNVLLGWTLLGWAAALVWACTSNVKPLQEDHPKANRAAATQP